MSAEVDGNRHHGTLVDHLMLEDHDHGHIGPSHVFVVPDLVMDYQSACESIGRDHQQQWTQLGAVFGGRPGWWCGIDRQPGTGVSLLWSFGSLGASLINAHVTDEGMYYCHDHLRDNDPLADLETDDLGRVRAWVDEHEPAAALVRMPGIADSEYRYTKAYPFPAGGDLRRKHLPRHGPGRAPSTLPCRTLCLPSFRR